MPQVRLYNTMSQSVEPFSPADGKVVRMYTCGPTVYNPAHLGNFRTFLFEDLMRRVLKLAGWRVEQVMNLTDVDDKIIRRASEAGDSISEVTVPVTERLSLRPATISASRTRSGIRARPRAFRR